MRLLLPRSRVGLLAAAACLGVALITGALWQRSYVRESPQAYSFLMSDARYTLRSVAGRVVLLGPRPLMGAQKGIAVRYSNELFNQDFGWRVQIHRRDRGFEQQGGFQVGIVIPDFEQRDKSAREVGGERKGMLEFALLRSLEDPNKFAAAHLLLCDLTAQASATKRQVDTRVLVNYAGLEVELRPSVPPATAPGFGVTGIHPPITAICRGPQQVHYESAQLTRIRQYWHESLDVELVSVRYAYVFLGSLFFLSFPVLSIVRRHLRATGGLCVNCGYDLRASTEGCPECGHPHANRSHAQTT